MTSPIKPTNGGFLRPFGTAWFIIEFLKGNAPEDSNKIDLLRLHMTVSL
jgi:hypothetical protein